MPSCIMYARKSRSWWGSLRAWWQSGHLSSHRSCLVFGFPSGAASLNASWHQIKGDRPDLLFSPRAWLLLFLEPPSSSLRKRSNRAVSDSGGATVNFGANTFIVQFPVGICNSALGVTHSEGAHNVCILLPFLWGWKQKYVCPSA